MIKSLLLLLLLVGSVTHHARARKKKDCAAVWVDDGKGHTVKAELPPEEARVLKKQMLDLLGLQEPPRRHRHHHHKFRGSAPQFLKNIYDALDERGNAPHLDEEYREAVSVADTIITFINKGSPMCLDSSSNRRLFFDVSKVPMELSLLGAELRLYRSPLPLPIGPKEKFIVKIYFGAKEKSSERLISSFPLPDEGWISLNLTSAMLSWIILPETNRGIRIAVTRPKQKHELHLHKVGISGAHDKDAYRPFMVGFFVKPDREESILLTRHIRSIELKSGYSNPYVTAAVSPMLSDSPTNENQCQKRPLYVSFKDLGWGEWVIAPVGYNANFCDGRCKFPMLADMNATNHAIIQTLVKMKHAINNNDDLPPDASCAPKDLASISVLYYDYSNNVVLKKYPQMIVKTCACL